MDERNALLIIATGLLCGCSDGPGKAVDGGGFGDAAPDLVAPGPPAYPIRVLARNSPYSDTNSQYRFQITVASPHWAVLGLSFDGPPAGVSIDLYSDGGARVATSDRFYDCSVQFHTGFIAIAGARVPSGTTYHAVVNTAGLPYIVEYTEAAAQIPMSTDTCGVPGALACADIGAGHVVGALDLPLQAGKRYSLRESGGHPGYGCLTGCGGPAGFRQFVVDSGAARGLYAHGGNYLFTSLDCSGCGSPQDDIVPDPAADELHGLIAINARPPQGGSLCFNARTQP